MKKLTSKDAEKILKERPARRYIQSKDDGKVIITFDSEIFVTKKNEEDILGFVWEKDWDKVEARVFLNGEPKIYSLGGVEFSFVADFISTCKKTGVDMDHLAGEMFEIEKTGDWTQNIKYLGKSDSSGVPTMKEIPVEENLIRDASNTILDIKTNNPDLIKGWSTKDLVTALSVRGRMHTTQATRVIPELVKLGLIEIKEDRVKVL